MVHKMKYAILVYLIGYVSSLYISSEFMSKQVGETFMVTCKDTKNGRPVTWRNPKNQMLSSNSRPKTTVAPYGTFIFFEKVTEKDSGVYTCKSDKESAKFLLEVVEKLQFKDTPTQQEASEGDKKATLRCEVLGGNATWIVDGNEAQPPKYEPIGDGLLINDIVRADANVSYVCRAFQQSTGETNYTSINLIVKYPPTLSPDDSKDETVYGYESGFTNLSCLADGVPTPVYEWFHRNTKLRKEKEPVLTVLIESGSLGKYRCKATNELGHIEKHFKLKLGSKPNPPNNFEVIATHPQSAVLKIDEPLGIFEPDMEPLEYNVQYKKVEEDIDENYWPSQDFEKGDNATTYELKELQSDTKYEVRVATRNRAGLSDYTNSTTFKTEPSKVGRISANFLVSCILFLITSSTWA